MPLFSYTREKLFLENLKNFSQCIKQGNPNTNTKMVVVSRVGPWQQLSFETPKNLRPIYI